ncbi:response regulator [Acidisoma sp. C75]
MTSVLLVEDEWLIRTIMAEELVEAGFDVLSFESGDEGAAFIEENGCAFDLLVTDIHMPGETDGIALARLVQQRCPAMPIIYTTGRPDALDRADTRGPKVLALVKPYKPSRLIAAIRSVTEPTAPS